MALNISGIFLKKTFLSTIIHKHRCYSHSVINKTIWLYDKYIYAQAKFKNNDFYYINYN